MVVFILFYFLNNILFSISVLDTNAKFYAYFWFSFWSGKRLICDLVERGNKNQAWNTDPCSC